MKSGFVSIIGKPNAGKSTLLNCIIGEKIAAVSNKPQTTRNAISGIYSKKDLQIVFMDTPGIHKPKNKLGEFMEKEIEGAMASVDAAILVVDCTEREDFNDDIINNLSSSQIPVFLVLNKIDLVDKDDLLKIMSAYSTKMNFTAFVPLSAANNDGVDLLLKEIESEKYDLWWENIIYSIADEENIETLDVDGEFWSEIDYFYDYEKILSHVHKGDIRQ